MVGLLCVKSPEHLVLWRRRRAPNVGFNEANQPRVPAQTRGVVTMAPLDDADVSSRGLCEGPSPRRYAQVIGRLRVSTGGDETARRRRSTSIAHPAPTGTATSLEPPRR